MAKKCFFCGSSNVVHNGLRGHTQKYKCNDCGRRFDGGQRRDKSQVEEKTERLTEQFQDAIMEFRAISVHLL